MPNSSLLPLYSDYGGDGESYDQPSFLASFSSVSSMTFPPTVSSLRGDDAAANRHLDHLSKRQPSSSFSTSMSPTSTSSTVLYLGFGSNMAASTFEGRRGIRPLSAVSVSVPTLRLVFDLPGIPYIEPCFANTAFRRVPKIPKVPLDPPFAPAPPLVSQASTVEPESIDSSTGLSALAPVSPPLSPPWDGPMYGVVYEVTPQDYAHILATEGGGSSYHEVIVPCLPIPPRISIPEKPPFDPPRPFLARTLFAPLGQEEPGHGEDSVDKEVKEDDGGLHPKGREDPDRNDWIERLLKLSLMRARPNRDYAQPSRRYLDLLVTGAREHELPPAYQTWLQSLVPYERTSWRQTMGAVVTAVLVLPVFGLVQGVPLLLNKLFGGDGKLPLGCVIVMGLYSRGIWWLYDTVLKRAFGDGERTAGEEEDGDESGETSPFLPEAWQTRQAADGQV